MRFVWFDAGQVERVNPRIYKLQAFACGKRAALSQDKNG